MWARAHNWEHLELLHDPRILNGSRGDLRGPGTDQRRRAIIFRPGGVALSFNARTNSRSLRAPRSHDGAATDAVENYFGELAEGLNNFWPLTLIVADCLLAS